MTRQDRRGGRGATALMGSMALLLLSGCGTPSIAPPPSYPNFTQADLDHNNVVTQEEWLQAGLHQFDALDTNHDGTVSADEIIPPFAAYDTDKDGTISPAEFNKGLV